MTSLCIPYEYVVVDVGGGEDCVPVCDIIHIRSTLYLFMISNILKLGKEFLSFESRITSYNWQEFFLSNTIVIEVLFCAVPVSCTSTRV